MSAIVQRFVRADDLTPERGWQLIEWCIERGGDEFSVQFMRLDGEPPASHGQLSAALEPFHHRTVKREHVTTPAGEASRRPTDIWRACADSVTVLRHHLLDGVFAAPSYSMAGWFEDFTVYRRGEIMLGVVSHEAVAILRVTGREQQERSKLKIESHETAT